MNIASNLDVVNKHISRHKYAVFDVVWVSGGLERSAWKGTVLRQLYEQVTADLLIRKYLVNKENGRGTALIFESDITGKVQK